MDKLNCCPYCGCSNESQVKVMTVLGGTVNNPFTDYFVCCTNCGAYGPRKLDKEEAIKQWNEVSSIVSLHYARNPK